MIKNFEKIIKIILIIVVLWCFKILFTDISNYLIKSNNSQKELDKLSGEVHSLSSKLDKSKAFYEENRKVIEDTKIKDEDIYAIFNGIFEDVTDKKLGFFISNVTEHTRDTKLINSYKIEVTLSLTITSLFSLEELKPMIDAELIKQLSLFNKTNNQVYDLTVLNSFIEGEKDYKFSFLLIKKHIL